MYRYIVGGIFQTQEILRGYYIIFKQILENYGIPVLIKTDNRTFQGRLVQELRIAGIDNIDDANEY